MLVDMRVIPYISIQSNMQNTLCDITELMLFLYIRLKVILSST